MVIFTYFVDIDNGVNETVDRNSEDDNDARSSVHDNPGKSFFMLKDYKNWT